MREYQVWLSDAYNTSEWSGSDWLLYSATLCPLEAIAALNELTDKGYHARIERAISG